MNKCFENTKNSNFRLNKYIEFIEFDVFIEILDMFIETFDIFIEIINVFIETIDVYIANLNKIKITTKNDNNISFKKKKEKICVNFDYSITLRNRQFIKKQLNKKMKIQQLIFLLSMKKINNKLIKINDFVKI